MSEGENEAGRGDLADWLASTGFVARERRQLPGDVSPRRYARLVLDSGATAILATYPAEARDACSRFRRTTELLTGGGVPVPRVLAADCDRGFMLVEDLGSEMLADLAPHGWAALEPYFVTAMEHGERIARLPDEGLAALNPPLDGPLLRKELAQSWDLFLAPRGLTGDPALTADLADALDRLCADLGAEPQVVCHRDYMARNLVPLSSPGELPARLSVLDHQDLRLGPPFYDLASLLNDSLFPPAEAHERLLAAALRGPDDRLRYRRAAAQRTLKAVGTYVSFARRGSDRHLPLVAPTLGRCLDHLARLPEHADLARRLAPVWRSVLEPTAP